MTTPRRLGPPLLLLALGLALQAGCSTIRWQDVAAASVAGSCRNSAACRLNCPPPGTPAGAVPAVCQSAITGIPNDPNPPGWRQ